MKLSFKQIDYLAIGREASRLAQVLTAGFEKTCDEELSFEPEELKRDAIKCLGGCIAIILMGIRVAESLDVETLNWCATAAHLVNRRESFADHRPQ